MRYQVFFFFSSLAVIFSFYCLINLNSKYILNNCTITKHRIDKYSCNCNPYYCGYVTYTVLDYGNKEFEIGSSSSKFSIEDLMSKKYPLNSTVNCFLLHDVSHNISDITIVLPLKIDMILFISFSIVIFILTFSL